MAGVGDVKRTLILIVGLVLVVTGAVMSVTSFWDLGTHQEPVDFELNWVAAHRLVDREPLYDRAASKQEGLERVGPSFGFADGGTFSSFIGSPATALAMVPFVPFSRGTAAGLFRGTQALLMAAAIVIVGFALPRRSRVPAWLVGFGVALWSFPVWQSIGLGQIDGYVMVAVAVAIWASTRDRWRLVGVALGIAAMLKISPVLLIVYLVLRGRRQVLLPAVASAVALLAAAAAIGRPADVATWATDVAPDVSKGAFLFTNQSIPAWSARLFGSTTNWQSLDAGIGAWRFLAWVVAGVGIAAVYLLCRRRSFVPLELGAVLLVALLAGPISWEHYPTWALLSVVLLADVGWWEHRPWGEIVPLGVVMAFGILMMRAWTLYPTSLDFVPDTLDRITSGYKTMGMLAFLAVALWLLARPCAASHDTVPGEGGEVGRRRLSADEQPTEGVHPHG